MIHGSRAVSAGRRGDDRVRIVVGARLALVLADGAGGTSHAGEAADAVVALADVFARDAGDAADALEHADRALERIGGMSTGVVVAVSGSRIVGASVGDSRAVVFQASGREELTARQHRKPLLGSGVARPVAFGAAAAAGARLVVGSDGLFNYVPLAKIAAVIAAGGDDLERMLDSLVDAARLPNGALQDDVAIGIVIWP